MAATKLEQQQIEEAQLLLECELSEQLQQRQDMLSVIAELQSQVDAIDEQVKERMMREGCYKLTVNDLPVTLTEIAGRQTLDKKLLVEQGVTTEQIKAATKTGEKYWRFTVGKPKESAS